jgi:hypothetical protein
MQWDFIRWSMLMLVILNLLLIERKVAEFDIERGREVCQIFHLHFRLRISIKQERKGNAVGPGTWDYSK